MSTYGFDDLVVKVDDANGDLQSIVAYVTEVSGFEIEAVLEDGHTAGDSWAERVFTGLKKANEFTLKGFYDNTADTGSYELLMDIGETRSFQFTWGTSKTSDFECIVKKFSYMPTRGEMSKFEAVLAPTGAVSEDA